MDVVDRGEGDANPTVLDVKCDNGDPIAAIGPSVTDPAMDTWSHPMNLRTPPWAGKTFEGPYMPGQDEFIGQYSWYGGLGTHVNLTQRVICSHS